MSPQVLPALGTATITVYPTLPILTLFKPVVSPSKLHPPKMQVHQPSILPEISFLKLFQKDAQESVHYGRINLM
jgi:hypothetical protein